MESLKTQTAPYHPLMVWESCFMWLFSMFFILWSLLLFFCVGDILVLTGTDIINAIVLLSGVIMLPTNVHILCSISHARKIDYKSKVVCCPMWLCIMWIVLINLLGVVCCIHKMYNGRIVTIEKVNRTMKHYRSVPKFKHFVDNLQWSLKCCGLHSYQDWFERDWYDKIRDYEWDPNVMRQKGDKRRHTEVTDSVPLSCCKTGSCISNYLLELGTHYINTQGCGNLLHRIIMISMIVHLVLFLAVIIIELSFLKLIFETNQGKKCKKRGDMNVRHIMSMNDRFAVSSNSLQINPDDSDYENEVHLGEIELSEPDPVPVPSIRMALDSRVNIDDEDSESP